jgi:hypothetical protein
MFGSANIIFSEVQRQASAPPGLGDASFYASANSLYNTVVGAPVDEAVEEPIAETTRSVVGFISGLPVNDLKTKVGPNRYDFRSVNFISLLKLHLSQGKAKTPVLPCIVSTIPNEKFCIELIYSTVHMWPNRCVPAVQ